MPKEFQCDTEADFPMFLKNLLEDRNQHRSKPTLSEKEKTEAGH